MVMYHISDILMQQLLAQDDDAFAVFYGATIDDFARYIQFRYQLPQSVLQDILSQFYLKLRNYLPKLDEDIEENRFYAFVWTMLKNLLKDYFKKSKEFSFSDFRLEEADDDVALPLVSEDDVAALFSQRFEYDRIMETLRGLDNTSHDIVYMKYIEGYDYDEIAESMQMSVDAVRKQHSRAIRSLQL
jgi:RNA polymerase sigma factor (sigma-70 family)